MSIIESLLALGRLIEEAIRSVASAANGGRVAFADRSLRLTAALRERYGCSPAWTGPSGHRLKAVGAQVQNDGENGAAERMCRRKLAGLSEPKWRFSAGPSGGRWSGGACHGTEGGKTHVRMPYRQTVSDSGLASDPVAPLPAAWLHVPTPKSSM